MIAHTITGSIYEFNHKEQKVRRIFGQKDPTKRQGEDGEWRSYEKVYLEVNGSLVIVWETTDDGILKSTITSPIKKLARDSDVESAADVEIDAEALVELVGDKR